MKLDYLKPSTEVQARVAEVTAALAACQETSDALDRIAAEVAMAQAEVDAAMSQRAELLAERAKQTDAGKVRDYGPRLKELTDAMSAATLNLESATIASGALEAELLAREAVVQEMKQSGVATQIAAVYCADLAADIGQRVDEIVEKHLLPLILEAEALNQGTYSRGVQEWLSALVLPKFGSGRVVCNGTFGTLGIDGSERRRGDWMKDDTKLQAVIEVSRKVPCTVGEIANYIPRAQRMVKAVPYVRRSYTHLGVTGEARFDQERAAQDESAAQKSAARVTNLAAAQATVSPSKSAWGPRRSSDVPPRADIPISGEPGRQALADPDLAQFR